MAPWLRKRRMAGEGRKEAREGTRRGRGGEGGEWDSERAHHEDDARLVVAGVVEHLANEASALPDILVYNRASYNLRYAREGREGVEEGMEQPRSQEGLFQWRRAFRKLASMLLAMALASNVFPVPGGPYRSTPCGTRGDWTSGCITLAD